MIEDEEPATDIKSRRSFGTKVKEITANVTQRCHFKFRTGTSLEPFWRLIISLNDETENLMILPPWDDSVEDKIILLKVRSHKMPMPTVTNLTPVATPISPKSSTLLAPAPGSLDLVV